MTQQSVWVFFAAATVGCAGADDVRDFEERRVVAQPLLLTANADISVSSSVPATLNFMQSEQSIVRAVRPDNSRVLIAGFNDFTNDVTTPAPPTIPTLTNPFQILGLSVSTDDGATWVRSPQFQAPSGLFGRGDPWLTVNALNQRVVWYAGLATASDGQSNGTVVFSKSTNAGQSWSAMAKVPGCTFCDKPSVATGDAPSAVEINVM
jgi:hypothetical protein